MYNIMLSPLFDLASVTLIFKNLVQAIYKKQRGVVT